MVWSSKPLPAAPTESPQTSCEYTGKRESYMYNYQYAKGLSECIKYTDLVCKAMELFTFFCGEG